MWQLVQFCAVLVRLALPVASLAETQILGASRQQQAANKTFRLIQWHHIALIIMSMLSVTTCKIDVIVLLVTFRRCRVCIVAVSLAFVFVCCVFLGARAS